MFSKQACFDRNKAIIFDSGVSGWWGKMSSLTL